MNTQTTEYQLEIARLLGIEIDGHSFAVAAAQIEDKVAPALWLCPNDDEATLKQISYGASLGLDLSGKSKRVASARIQVELDRRNQHLIQEMGLEAGMTVTWKKHGREMEISSIAGNGRLWFKGGNGWGAFPHEIELPRPR